MDILIIFQIIIAVLLIVFILLQQKSAALGGAFGGGNVGGGEGESGTYSTRRGIQQKLHWATVACGALLIILALLNLVY